MIMLLEEDALSIEHLLTDVRDKVGPNDRRFMRIQADLLLKRLALARRGYPGHQEGKGKQEAAGAGQAKT